MNGLLLPFNTRPFVSRAVARHRGPIDPLVLLKALKRVDQAILPITRNRLALLGSVGFQLAACDPKPLPPSIATQHPATEHRRLKIQLQLQLQFHLGHGLIGDRAAVALR